MKNIIVIPARLKSSRLSNKVIRNLGGKPILQHVYDRCSQVSNAEGVFIAVDHDEVFDLCKTFTDRVIMTSVDHNSGTERISEVINSIECDNVINVQADEPFIEVELVERVCGLISDPTVEMASAAVPCSSEEEYLDPDTVKVVLDSSNKALYFSRAPIPYFRDSKFVEGETYKHIGIYAYKSETVRTLVNFEACFIEKAEKLEQLRAIHNGIKISMVVTDHNPIGIDTYEDYLEAQKIIGK